MRTLTLLALLTLSGGCGITTPHLVTLYNCNGEPVKQWLTSKGIWWNDGVYRFTDSKTGIRVFVSGTVVIERIGELQVKGEKQQ